MMTLRRRLETLEAQCRGRRQADPCAGRFTMHHGSLYLRLTVAEAGNLADDGSIPHRSQAGPLVPCFLEDDDT
jgi:hypothetical protein